MSLNDELEKLHQAEEWLVVGHRYSLYAWEHVCWVLENATDRKVHAEAERIAAKVDSTAYLEIRNHQLRDPDTRPGIRVLGLEARQALRC